MTRVVVWTVAGLLIGFIVDAWCQRYRHIIQGDWMTIRIAAGGLCGMLAARIVNYSQMRDE
jgi:hypothetical protein